ncbi:hypothetical protein GCM10009105_02480 [Dokdonella soli]|uniref:Uncharacterized protein n=1 Tax=Dokdonella soli TaxID=529810 RepID=A0ABN1IBX3_9GAMM
MIGAGAQAVKASICEVGMLHRSSMVTFASGETFMVEWMRRALEGIVGANVVEHGENVHNPPTRLDKWNDNANFMALGRDIQDQVHAVARALGEVLLVNGQRRRRLGICVLEQYNCANEELAHPGEVHTGFYLNDPLPAKFRVYLMATGYSAERTVEGRGHGADPISFVQPLVPIRQSLAHFFVSFGNGVRDAGWTLNLGG